MKVDISLDLALRTIAVFALEGIAASRKTPSSILT